MTNDELFAYRLCALLGRDDHPEDMLARMPYRHFIGWARYYVQEPWGDERDDMRQEVFRVRMLMGLIGESGSSMPEPLWPYVSEQNVPCDPVEATRRLKERYEEIKREREAQRGQRDSSTTQHPTPSQPVATS